MDTHSRKTILVVDDDDAVSKLLSLALADLDAELLTAADGEEALRRFLDHLPDLVILDIMMPNLDGYETCRQMRLMQPELPIIFLSALSRESHILRGFDCGAVDYVTKPFSPRILMSRVRAALRKSPPEHLPASNTLYRDGYLEIDLESRAVTVQGKLVKLTSTEFRLLSYLLVNAGRTLSLDQILDRVWGWEHRANPEYVHSYIWRLRQKLEPAPRHPRYLLTEPGLGYRFERQ